MLSRVAKLKGRDNILIGRDLSNVFKEGHVYGFMKIGGEILLKDLGEHFIPENMEYRTIDQVMMDGSYLLTPAEENKASQ